VLGGPTESVSCQRCGHGYPLHQPACTTTEDGVCDCAGFRWIDPAPDPDVLGYHPASGRR
jgi:hypothetical protein